MSASSSAGNCSSRAGKNNKDAAKFGLGLFGVLIVISLLLSIIALAIITHFDPHAANLLNKPNPVLNVPSNVAWLMIPVSILVVGPAEEYLFRGFIYGGLLSISKGRYWILLAVVSSVMFASVHAYYALTYGIASVLPFIDLITFGLAMSITYYWSGGNILVLALIHGLYDATDFLGVATTTPNWPSCTIRDDICRHRVCSSLPSQKNRHAPNA